MVTVSVEPVSRNRFLEALRRFAAETGQTMKDAALEQAALACQDAATFTPPLPKGGGRGLSKAAETAGDNAVAGDIRKLYVGANDRNSASAAALLSNQLAYATKTGDRSLFDKVIGKGTMQALKGLSPIMRKIANDQNHDRAFQKAKNYFNTTNPIRTEYGQGFVQDLRSPHNRIKGKFGGRIGKNVRPTKVKMLVESKGDLDAYIKERQAMVGYIKSGWASALRSLPKPMINGVPKDFGVEGREAGRDLEVLQGDVRGGDGRVVLGEVAAGRELGGGGRADQGNLNGLAGTRLSGGEDAGEGAERGELALEGSDNRLGQDGRSGDDGVSHMCLLGEG